MRARSREKSATKLAAYIYTNPKACQTRRPGRLFACVSIAAGLKRLMQKPVLLVAEDNPIDAMLLDRVIQRGGSTFHMIRVEHGEAAIDYMQGRDAFADR